MRFQVDYAQFDSSKDANLFVADLAELEIICNVHEKGFHISPRDDQVEELEELLKSKNLKASQVPNVIIVDA